ncbi:MAG TPA: LytTR family DNA-binding domain-containing protein [Chitinophagales bacterium]|nr:LytTR family DNA-binding domain-containing protein [Chitinophagales bacterium]HMX04374.1 LytTR family DNA-binding domain-containing protein [Chitinophagales bacterium]HMZ89335.1 LytTR family DNA-binding domain-containing protein [Chitinophagales bacterium]HNE47279.1 LytTR family DNA-binding domain-containing protein [Chitinophagales bacterium]HNF70166.1 LytTR family DNA-binding domain-containing protein [Chitinophagales bacterium]
MSYRCLIVDDESLALRLMEDHVSKVPGLEIVGKCRHALEALQVLQREEIDILFLDIQMPDLTGVELIKILKHKPAIILTTAYAEYALEGYQLEVVDYLLKPIALDRFLQAVRKAQEWVDLRKQAPSVPQTTKQDHFFVKSDYKQVRINYADVTHVEGLREYVSIYAGGKRIVTLETMKNMEQLLPSDLFMRVHKSYIVNTSRIKSINGNQIELGEIRIPLGKVFRAQVLGRLGIISSEG